VVLESLSADQLAFLRELEVAHAHLVDLTETAVDVGQGWGPLSAYVLNARAEIIKASTYLAAGAL
jgi:hypothetical protein